MKLFPSNRLLVSLLSLLVLTACSQTAPLQQVGTAINSIVNDTSAYAFEVPVGGNSWIANNIELSDKLIKAEGISRWKDTADILDTYFYLSETGYLELGLKVSDLAVGTQLKVTLANQSKQLTINEKNIQVLGLGTFTINEIGYQKVSISASHPDGTAFPQISKLLIGGSATQGNTYFVKDDFYWGRRGPSVHLQYQMPKKDQQYEWFYNEITVPHGQDQIGSYYMANGFNGGYFGIQVNSETERRVLFSIWSPYQTDDPTTIPEEYRIKLLKKGDTVVTGKFGNEGSGGQSYLQHGWKAGATYKFLTQIKPVKGEDKTDFTAYFYDPDIAQWQLIASFRRPKTSTYLAGAYSFLENFIPGAGQFERMANYSNQWVKTTGGEWQEVTKARFTYDATARKQARFDYKGGTSEQGFYLKNTGFFSDYTTYGTEFSRQPGVKPVINFSRLP